MKMKIAHYYGQVPPVPEAVPVGEPEENKAQLFEVDINHHELGNSLLDFAEKHGNIILSPPNRSPCHGDWFIWVTDSSGRFKQK